MGDSVRYGIKLNVTSNYNMLSILYLSRFGTNRHGRQCYDRHVLPFVNTARAVSVSDSFHTLGAGLSVVATSYYHLAAGVSVAWVSNRDDICIVEGETLNEQFSWNSSVVFRCVFVVPTRRVAIATTQSGDSSFRDTDSPLDCLAFLELLRRRVRVWKRSQHQVLPRRRSGVPHQRSILRLSVCCDWIDRIGRTTRVISPTSSFLNRRIDNT